MTNSYELAGGLSSPSGWTKIKDNEIRSVGPYHGDVRVVLKDGEHIIVKGKYLDQLMRVVKP